MTGSRIFLSTCSNNFSTYKNIKKFAIGTKIYLKDNYIVGSLLDYAYFQEY